MLHVSFRAPKDAVIESDEKNMVSNVYEVLDKIAIFSDSGSL